MLHWVFTRTVKIWISLIYLNLFHWHIGQAVNTKKTKFFWYNNINANTNWCSPHPAGWDNMKPEHIWNTHGSVHTIQDRWRPAYYTDEYSGGKNCHFITEWQQSLTEFRKHKQCSSLWVTLLVFSDLQKRTLVTFLMIQKKKTFYWCRQLKGSSIYKYK